MKFRLYPIAIAVSSVLLAANASRANSGCLTRIATVPLEVEITGLYEHDHSLFMNVQHPDSELPNEFSKATVGVWNNVNSTVQAYPTPTNVAQKQIFSGNPPNFARLSIDSHWVFDHHLAGISPTAANAIIEFTLGWGCSGQRLRRLLCFEALKAFSSVLASSMTGMG